MAFPAEGVLSLPMSVHLSVRPSTNYAQETFLQRTAAGSLEEMLQEEPLDYGKNTAMGWTIIWPVIVGALIHEAGTLIQALKPVCQFMAEDVPPPVLKQLVIRYLVSLLVRIKELSSPTGWQQSPQPQTEATKKSQKLDCIATGFIYNNAVNFTVDISLFVHPFVNFTFSTW